MRNEDLKADHGALLRAPNVQPAQEKLPAKGELEPEPELVHKLRQINQSLVIATLAAQDLQAKAEAQCERQQEFLALLAHELRNPMAPVSLACDILGSIADAHPRLPAVHQIIRRQMNYMKHMVDDLMDASRISTGKISLRRELIQLSAIIECAMETSQPFIDRAHHVLSLDLPSEAITINGDMNRLVQVISNLTIFASKLLPEFGHVAVSARLVPGAVEVTVENDAREMPKEFQSTIFELFVQGETSQNCLRSELGIGLMNARNIVDLHQGSIRIESGSAGLDSKFIVTLPVVTTGAKCHTNVVESPGPGHRYRILLIDDYLDMTETMTVLLEEAGHSVSSTFDGTAGIAMAKKNKYDVIICDVNLEGLSGYEVARRLRTELAGSAPRLVGTSCYYRSASQAHAIEVGFDHYLVKPIDFANLLKLLDT